MIEFKTFRKAFDEEPLLDIGHLILSERVYWLVGDIGVGKTTLLKSIAGLIPFRGDILVDGINIRKQKMKFRQIVNYAEAEPEYPKFLTGLDLLDLYRYTKKATSEQVKYLVDNFRIGEYAGTKAGSYSSGMAKKLSLILAFIGRPKLILLDEPFITLDQQAIIDLQRLIKEYVDSGISFLISSHQAFQIDNKITAFSLEVKNMTLNAR
jgi:ABC-2 type transport system ATP-binding protein